MDKQPFGVLIIHGFASSLDSVREVEPPLKSLGLPTSMPVLRGHNQSSPEALRGVKWHDWMADAEAALRSLMEEAEKIIIVGHSMGGLAALNLAADHIDSVDSLVLVAAAVQLANPLASGRPLHFLAPLVIRLFKKWSLPPVFADKALARYDTNYHWAPMDAIASFLEFSDFTRKMLTDVRAPALIMQSRKDTTVAAESAEMIYKRISTPEAQKRIMWFEQTEHEMFHDCEKDAVVAAVVEYVRERCGLKG